VKTELRPEKHSAQAGQTIIELWHDGDFIGTVAGADGPGVRIVTKHTVTAKAAPDDGSGVNVLEVAITPA
jgi:hypothetical protein